MIKNLICLLAIFFTILAASCTGKQGTTGPAGPQKAGVYYEWVYQQGVQPNAYNGQVETSLYNSYSAATYTSNVNPINVGELSSIGAYRPIIKFDISSLPTSKIIVDRAQLIINTNGKSDNGGAKIVSIYKVTNSWVVNKAGWVTNCYDYPYNVTSWNNPGGDFDSITITANGAGVDLPPNSKITIDLDPITVLFWMENPSKNYGMIFVAADEYNPNYSEIYSSGAVTPIARPLLKIWYYTTE